MISSSALLWVLAAWPVAIASALISHLDVADPCAVIANKTWVAPADVRACFESFPVKPELKTNVVEVINKTLAFHTSVNYQRAAPAPFNDVHEDIMGDLARISNNDKYTGDFQFHVDVSRALKRLNDGHCVYINLCYDSVFLSYLPIPLVLLTAPDGTQHVHITPEAYNISKAEFGDQLELWESVLSSEFEGGLSSLSGAEVLFIDYEDPFEAVNASAQINGGYQGFGTRQNMFFSSYGRSEAGWIYSMGYFAQQSLPLVDNVTITVQREGVDEPDTFTLPYRSRVSPYAPSWNDSESYFANNCLATNSTNGVDLYTSSDGHVELYPTIYGQQTLVIPHSAGGSRSKRTGRKHWINAQLDIVIHKDIELPSELTPKSPLEGSSGVAQFFMLDSDESEEKTGVLVLGSFSANSFDDLQESLLMGLKSLKDKGATRLVVDVTNNGGGYICIAHWLHRIIAGPKETTIPQAGLQTQTRAGPLAQLIVQSIAKGGDPENLLLYNPLNWEYANNRPFPADLDWLQDPVARVINERNDAFSQRLGDECQPFEMDPPLEALFDSKKVAIVSNGRCGSSCSLFSITMAKEEGAITVVVGGKADVSQQYCGVVGGQSTNFKTIDTEIKTTKLKDHKLAPPDFLTNSIQGITWRLGFGIDDPTEPEEWQDHPADVNLPLTSDLVNNPVAIWTKVAETVL